MKHSSLFYKAVHIVALISLLFTTISPALAAPTPFVSSEKRYLPLSNEKFDMSKIPPQPVEPVRKKTPADGHSVITAGMELSKTSEYPHTTVIRESSLIPSLSGLHLSKSITSTLYFPLIKKGESVPLPTGTEVLIKPGIGGIAKDNEGQVQAAFSPKSVTQDTWVYYQPLQRPNIITPNLAVGGPAFALTAKTAADNSPVAKLPHEVTIKPSNGAIPAYAVVTPSIVITVSLSETDIWGLDVRSLGLYGRTGPDQPWQRVPSAYYRDKKVIVAHVERLREFVPLGTLSVVEMAADEKRLVLDPDDNVGWAIWPEIGMVTETPFSVRLNKEVRDLFMNDGCSVEIFLTRDSETKEEVSRSMRVQEANNFEPDMFATLTFNALQGSPLWGLETNGGIVGWARDGNATDDALVNEFYARIQEYTGRPHLRPVSHPAFYTEFNDNLNSPTYAHIETLFLDHKFDQVVIDQAFSSVVDAAYAALRTQLEAIGMTCNGDPNDPDNFPTPPPLPAPPSAEQLQRWRDLGYQNLRASGGGYRPPIGNNQPYQIYGGDPVSFSTGNHVLQVNLTRIPARGGLDMDFTLTYNAQDGRDDLFGYGWSFPYNIRLQHYNDGSVSVVLHDGRTYHYTWNGSRYDPPAGVFDSLENIGGRWVWKTIQEEEELHFDEAVGGLGILTAWRDRRGNALHFSYDLSGQDNWKSGDSVPRPPLTEMSDDAGRTIEFTPNAEGHITNIKLPDTREFTFTYTNGDLTEITDGNGGTRKFEYDNRHRIVKEWDPAGILFLQNKYDDRDRVVEQIDASGTTSTLTYDPINRETTFTDNMENEYRYTYDAFNRVTAEIDPLTSVIDYTYDNDYHVTTMTDARGNETHYAYDSRGNRIEQTDPLASCTAADYSQDVTTWFYDDTPDELGIIHDDLTEMTDALGNVTTFDYDDKGNLLAIHQPGNRTTSFIYNAWGQPIQMTDANNHSTFYEYDTYGNLIKTTDADNNISTSTYDITGREVTYTDANQHTVTFDYDDNDNITTIIDPKGKPTTFIYDGNDVLIQSEDRRGVVSDFQYDENLKLTAERDFPDGQWRRYGYDALYRRTTMTDRRGYVTRYAYDDTGRLTATIDPLEATTEYEYDADDNLTAIIGPLGQRTELLYDAVSRLTALIDAAGYRTDYCYDPEDRLIRTSGSRGDVTHYSYDAVDNLTETIDPLTAITHYEYDPINNLTAIIDGAGHRTDYNYDVLDRLDQIIRPPVKGPQFDGSKRPTTQFTYDAVGNTTQVTSPRDFTTAFTYDENDNLQTATDPLGGQVRYAYDAEDNPIAVTDPKGYTTHLRYNAVEQPIAVEDALGYTTRLAYDADYNLTRLVNALDRATTYEYDPAARLVRTIDPLGHATTYQRDLQGQVTALTDANDHTTRYSYDVMDRLTTVTDALDQPTHYEYDAAGNLVGLIDANSHQTRFAYDLRNQLIREVNPLGHTWEYGYDAVGNLVRRIDAKRATTLYHYDSNNRLIGLDYPDATGVRFGYDLDGNEVEMCDWLAAEGDCFRTSYDALGRPRQTTDWLGRTLSRSYDAAGNLTGLIYPNNNAVRYDYDARNQLVRLQDHFGQDTVYQYDAIGQLTDIARPNGATSRYTYDEANRLIAISHREQGQPFAAFAYALDKVGNRTQITELRTFINDGPPTPVTTVKNYTYDALDRLIGADTDQGQQLDYAFDPVGNRLAQTGIPQEVDPTDTIEPIRPGPPLEDSANYNEANQLTSVNRQSSSVTLDYDANGNRIRETETLPNDDILLTEYRYDFENRLTGVTKSTNDTPTMTATYTYDGYGRRVKKDVSNLQSPVSNLQITYLYNGLDPVADYETRNDETTATYYYWANGGIAEIERLPNPTTGFPGDVHWTHTDGLDSLIDLTNATGDTTTQLYYDEYGQLQTQSVSLGRYSYTGQEYDPETGLYHFYARYYDPELGVWLTQDPYRGWLGEPGTLQRYGYGGNNPISYRDKYGYFLQYVGGAVGGAVKGIATEVIIKGVENVAEGKDFFEFDEKDRKEIIAAGLGGAVEGTVLVATGSTVAASAAGGFVEGYTKARWANGESANEALVQGASSAVFNAGFEAIAPAFFGKDKFKKPETFFDGFRVGSDNLLGLLDTKLDRRVTKISTHLTGPNGFIRKTLPRSIGSFAKKTLFKEIYVKQATFKNYFWDPMFEGENVRSSNRLNSEIKTYITSSPSWSGPCEKKYSDSMQSFESQVN